MDRARIVLTAIPGSWDNSSDPSLALLELLDSDFDSMMVMVEMMARRMREEAINAYGNITLVSGSFGNFLGVFREFSGNSLGVLKEYFGNILGTLKECFGNFQDNLVGSVRE